MKKAIGRKDEEIDQLQKENTHVTVTIVQLRVEENQLELEKRQLETRIKEREEGENPVKKRRRPEKPPGEEPIQRTEQEYHNNNYNGYNENIKKSTQHYSYTNNKYSENSENFERKRYNQQRGNNERNNNWSKRQETNQWGPSRTWLAAETGVQPKQESIRAAIGRFTVST